MVHLQLWLALTTVVVSHREYALVVALVVALANGLAWTGIAGYAGRFDAVDMYAVAMTAWT